MPAHYTFTTGSTPIVATAIHDGHHTREELNEHFNLSDEERLREEDPYTAEWLTVTDSNIIMHHSRFETDVNRSPEKAIYLKPEDAWGLQVWKNDLSPEAEKNCRTLYNNFYTETGKYFDELFTKFDKIVVYDMHTYNHRRESPDTEAVAEENPEVNIGTKNMNQQVWSPLVQTLMSEMRKFNFDGRHLDVRENVKFKGGYFGQWLYEKYGDKICPISIEFKKFFMDEWTGEPLRDDVNLIKNLMLATREPVLKALSEI
ncbi:MAG: N-formylglutamate amidohydrolase [Ferruginibacter sp.]